MNMHTLDECCDGVEPTEHPLILGYDPDLYAGIGLNVALLAPPLSDIPLTKAKIFQPPSADDTPRSLFTHHALEHTVLYCHTRAHRHVRRFVTDPREILIYADGSCPDQSDAAASAKLTAGCAFVFKPPPYPRTSCQFRLENKGPTGEEHPQTKNRAELRAVLGTSEYVVLGATKRIDDWAQGGWKTEADNPVENVDLWKMLLAEINYFASNGVEVAFWRIPRSLNMAIGPAEEAAKGKERTKYENISGFGV